MKSQNRKKSLILAGLVVLLGAAVTANWYLTSKPGTKPAESVSGVESENGVNLGDARYVSATEEPNEYFATARMSRNEAYDKTVASLKDVINNSIDEGAAVDASASLAQISDNKLIENSIETLVSAKIGGDCVCVVNTDSVEVIVENKYLTDNSVLQIKEIVLSNSEISPENITIIGAK